jgi:hypothetical protein
MQLMNIFSFKDEGKTVAFSKKIFSFCEVLEDRQIKTTNYSSHVNFLLNLKERHCRIHNDHRRKVKLGDSKNVLS